VSIAVISGRRSAAVAVRCSELGIEHVYQGIDDKLGELRKLARRLRIDLARCACIGDDAPDTAMMRAVGMAFAVADAHPQARRAARFVTRAGGGRGAVREVCDRLLAAHPT
jgi:3-deoxy-D-manno-octulosonate 8-phosphate phosphatase (KDO 8-P phosphatase)